jgi:hypothetical protein
VLNVLGAALYLAMLSSDAACSAELDRLLALRDHYGLPHPLKDAVLVRFVRAPRVGFEPGGKRNVSRYDPELGYSPDGCTVFGLRNFHSKNSPVEVESFVKVKPDPAVLGNLIPAELEVALEFHARGWTSLARATYRRWLRGLEWEPDASLAKAAWRYWYVRIAFDPDTPLPVMLRYMKRLIKHPKIDSPDTRRLIQGFELALESRNSKPGSDEALIDALLNVSVLETAYRDPSAAINRPTPDIVPAHIAQYRDATAAINRRGLDIVPALIAHLDDERLTRHYDYDYYDEGGLGIGGGFERIQDVVLRKLQYLAGENFVPYEAPRNERLKVIVKWYADAHKLGEEKYLVSRILGNHESIEHHRMSMLWVLAEKYPQRVPEVYRKIVDTRPGHDEYAASYAQVIADSQLPPVDKWKLFKYAATQKDPNHRNAGIRHLQPFDPKQAKKLLLATLAREPISQTKEDRDLVQFAAEGTDPDIWRALALAMRSAEVDTRGWLLDQFAEIETPTGRRHRLVLIADYLSDDERYKENEEYFGPAYSLYQSRTEVRNVATFHLWRLLNIGGEIPGEDWTAAQWSELRAKVRAKLAEELK